MLRGCVAERRAGQVSVVVLSAEFGDPPLPSKAIQRCRCVVEPLQYIHFFALRGIITVGKVSAIVLTF